MRCAPYIDQHHAILLVFANRIEVCDDNGGVVARKTEHIVDELLVLASQDGDVRALGALVQRYDQPLLRHAWRLTGDADAARDVAQESWLAIARNLRRLADPARFRPWAFRIVTHKAADWVRRAQRDRQLEKTIKDREPRSASSDSNSDAETNESDRTRRLRHAITRLPSELRAVIDLHYRESMSMNEMAHVLDVPAGTVKSRLHSARAQLKQMIERNEP